MFLGFTLTEVFVYCPCDIRWPRFRKLLYYKTVLKLDQAGHLNMSIPCSFKQDKSPSKLGKEIGPIGIAAITL